MSVASQGPRLPGGSCSAVCTWGCRGVLDSAMHGLAVGWVPARFAQLLAVQDVCMIDAQDGADVGHRATSELEDRWEGFQG